MEEKIKALEAKQKAVLQKMVEVRDSARGHFFASKVSHFHKEYHRLQNQIQELLKKPAQ